MSFTGALGIYEGSLYFINLFPGVAPSRPLREKQYFRDGPRCCCLQLFCLPPPPVNLGTGGGARRCMVAGIFVQPCWLIQFIPNCLLVPFSAVVVV